VPIVVYESRLELTRLLYADRAWPARRARRLPGWIDIAEDAELPMIRDFARNLAVFGAYAGTSRRTGFYAGVNVSPAHAIRTLFGASAGRP
jgi:hypothetical protein